MIQNRSVPTSALIAHVHYPDLAEAIAWLSHTFGFREHFRYGEPLSGAQMHLGDAWLMLKQTPPRRPTPAELGFCTQNLTIFVDDLDAHFAAAKAQGARIVDELHETVYGERQYGVEDLAGHLWIFSRHARDLSPEDWGAKVAESPSNALAANTSGQTLPARDPDQ